MDLRIGMSAMSASPPVGLPLSLIADHKVGGKAVGGGAAAAVANGMEPAPPSPHPPADVPLAIPPPAISPPISNPPVQGINQTEGGPVAPGSGNSASGGSGEVEANSVVGDVPPADAQPCVPSAPATVPLAQEPVLDQADAAVEADPAPPAVPDIVERPDLAAHPPPEAPPPDQAAQPSCPAVQEQSEPSPPVPESNPAVPEEPANAVPATPTPVPSNPPASATPQENAKPTRPHKRKAKESDSETKKPAKEVESPVDDGRKSKRMRLPTQPYQSPIPELNLIAKMNNTPKQSEEKLIVFYRNEFLAVRNAEGGFYVCQTMQNIYRSSSKIKIRWFSQGANDTYTPDFYDTTEFDCILTNLNLDKVEKDKYKLPEVENQRTQSILKRAIDVEKGVAQPADSALTEEHPDGLDLSLYRHEDQLKKRRKKKRESSSKKAKVSKSPVEVKKSTRTSSRNSSGSSVDDSVISNTKSKSVGKTNSKSTPRTSKKDKPSEVKEKGKKKAEVNNKKEPERTSSRRSTASGPPSSRRQADKTKSQEGEGAKQAAARTPATCQAPARPTRATRSAN